MTDDREIMRIAPLVIELLDAGPLTAAQIADALSMNRHHVSARLLPKFADHGLLTRSGDRWGVVTDDAEMLTAAEVADDAEMLRLPTTPRLLTVAEVADDAEMLTATEVADRLGKSRRTVGRMLAAGDFPGAERTSQGWRIPADALDAQTDPADALDAQTDPADAASAVLTGSPTPSTADTVARITAELEEWRRRAEVAEAIAAERADALADARTSLALAQRLAALTIAENVTPIPQAVEQTTGMTSTVRRWLPRRWR